MKAYQQYKIGLCCLNVGSIINLKGLIIGLFGFLNSEFELESAVVFNKDRSIDTGIKVCFEKTLLDSKEKYFDEDLIHSCGLDFLKLQFYDSLNLCDDLLHPPSCKKQLILCIPNVTEGCILEITGFYSCARLNRVARVPK